MNPIEIKDNIYWVGANDRTTDLFEGTWPIPNGISYNTYLIDDEKLALVDTIKTSYEDKLLENIDKIATPSDIDYIITHHYEPDHSGALPTLRRIAPDAKIILTEKATGFLENFFGITKNTRTVETGDTLDLGKRTLKFFETPFVHWPETMMSYIPSDKLLFSGDAFGKFGALEGSIFNDDVDYQSNEFESEVLRYFANIVAMYSPAVQSALDKLSDLDVEMIASTHGPVWRSDVEKIVELYDKFSRVEGENGVTIVYGSMYGNTKEMMEAVAEGVKASGCEKLEILDASRTHLSYLLSEAWRRKGLIVGSPTYDARIFPPVDQFLTMAKRKKLRNRVMGIFGSYGWSGGSTERMESIAKDMDWELVKPVAKFRGKPTEEELKEAKKLGKKVGGKVK